MAPATSIKASARVFRQARASRAALLRRHHQHQAGKGQECRRHHIQQDGAHDVEALEGDALATARAYSRMLDPMLKQGNTMNQPALYDEEAPAGTPGTGDVLAASMADLITPKQLGLIEGLCSTRRIRADEAATSFFSQPVKCASFPRLPLTGWCITWPACPCQRMRAHRISSRADLLDTSARQRRKGALPG
jgi:hypothetical protein